MPPLGWSAEENGSGLFRGAGAYQQNAWPAAPGVTQRSESIDPELFTRRTTLERDKSGH